MGTAGNPRPQCGPYLVAGGRHREEGRNVPERLLTRERRRLERWLSLLVAFLADLLSWRPTTLLGYLFAVAVVGILLALALIVGVKFHILHRLR